MIERFPAHKVFTTQQQHTHQGPTVIHAQPAFMSQPKLSSGNKTIQQRLTQSHTIYPSVSNINTLSSIITSNRNNAYSPQQKHTTPAYLPIQNPHNHLHWSQTIQAKLIHPTRNFVTTSQSQSLSNSINNPRVSSHSNPYGLPVAQTGIHSATNTHSNSPQLIQGHRQQHLPVLLQRMNYVQLAKGFELNTVVESQHLWESGLTGNALHQQGREIAAGFHQQIVNSALKSGNTGLASWFQDKGNQAATFRQLSKWIIPHEHQTTSKHPMGRKAQHRYYDSPLTAATALKGWVEAKPGRRLEKHMSRIVSSSSVVNEHLDSLLSRMHGKVMDDFGSNPTALRELNTRFVHTPQTFGDHTVPLATGRQWGTYLSHDEHGSSTALSPLDVMKNPAKFDFQTKINLLHDMHEYVRPNTRPGHWPKTQGSGHVGDPTQGDKIITTRHDQQLVRTSTDRGQILGDRKDVKGRTLLRIGTVDEHSGFTEAARAHQMPVWATPSHTIVRMLKTAEWAGATAQEKEAMTWGMAAHWRLNYDHKTTAYHTFHETFDTAANFGVNYQPMTYHMPMEYVASSKYVQNQGMQHIMGNIYHSQHITDQSEAMYGAEVIPQRSGPRVKFTPIADNLRSGIRKLMTMRARRRPALRSKL